MPVPFAPSLTDEAAGLVAGARASVTEALLCVRSAGITTEELARAAVYSEKHFRQIKEAGIRRDPDAGRLYIHGGSGEYWRCHCGSINRPAAIVCSDRVCKHGGIRPDPPLPLDQG